jgi:hypothetical protein
MERVLMKNIHKSKAGKAREKTLSDQLEAEQGMAMRESESVNGWDQSKDSSTTRPHIKDFDFKDEGLWMGTESVKLKLTS